MVLVSAFGDAVVADRLRYRLHDMWVPGRLELGPLTALDELRDWLDDERWWEAGSPNVWRSLCRDVDDALRSAAAPLYSVAAVPIDDLLAELDALERALRTDKKPPARTAASRLKLRRLEHVVRSALSRPEAVHAAWTGLLDACRDGADRRTLDQRQAELWYAAERTGHPWDRLFRLMGGVLADSERCVCEVQDAVASGTIRIVPRPPADRPARMAISERLRLLDRYLRLPVADARSEVWVGVEDAFFDAVSLEVGPVTFWNGPRLRSAVDGGGEDGTLVLPRMIRRHQRLFQWLWENRHARAGFALAQVPIDRGRPSEARYDAQQTVRAVLVLAELDEGFSAWRVAERGLLHFADGEFVFRDQLEPGDVPVGLRVADLARDNTPQALRERAPAIASHLPLRSGLSAVRHALELVRWFVQGRSAPGPARIVLAKRVIERTAGWAGVREEHFTDSFLAIPWARRQVVGEIGDAVHGALAALRADARAGDRETWRELHAGPRRMVTYNDADRAIVDTSAAVEHLDWLIDRLEADRVERLQLERLVPLVATGEAFAGRVDELHVRFRLLRRRHGRHRNAIVHGGPINEQSVDSVLLFVDAVAVDTLAAVLEAVFAGETLPAYLGRRRDAYDDWLDRVRTSGLPVHRTLGIAI